MKLVKVDFWSVRGDLEFNKLVTVRGREYRLVSLEPYTSKSGFAGDLLVWEGCCSTCGHYFNFRTGRSKFYPTANCENHRPTNSSRRS